MTPETSAIPSGDTERVERERLIALYESYRDQPSGFAMEDYADWSADAHALLRADAETMKGLRESEKYFRDLVLVRDETINTLRTRLRESEDEARRLREAAALLVQMARTSGGVAGHDPELCAACDAVQDALAAHPAESAQTGEGK